MFINCSRTIYQEAAPDAHRARVLSIYQLGFMGAAPIGSLCAGVTSGLVGPLATLHLCAATMTGVVALVWSTTGVANME